MTWLALGLQSFGDQQLFIFETGDLVLIGADHARVVGFDDALHQLIDLLIDLACLLSQSGQHLFGLCQSLAPGIFKHVCCHTHKRIAGLHGAEDSLELGFHLVAPDGLAIAVTAFGEAHIIW
ncbi:hypothetical protein [Ruegeria aquimaris]|uniref:Uncharacterized protein n=1 Tax=Ruegeria aquimaris TaxID=2984333 RepID=A0ABT3AN77_9RHOB|nr:hypothetical protein [Ruegeria sp. XHP0148]MCV2890125.1 hypothetical protein [Ruegeria sp. XHP0148]